MITVRPARLEDSEAFLALIDALADYEQLERPAAAARERLLRDAFEATPPLFEAFLAEAEGVGAVGYAIVIPTYSSFLAKPTLYLEDLFVLPDGRTSGAGTALLRFLAAESLRRGYGRMEWVCLDWNQLAQDFYLKRGAKLLSEWRFFRMDEAGMNRLVTEQAENNS